MSHFVEFSVLIAIAAGISVIMRLIRQPMIIGYILTGLIVGPLFLKVASSLDMLTLFSEIGIAILLFLVGLHLHPKNIKEFGSISFITGIGQVLFTSLIGFGICMALGFGLIPSIYVGVALAFSSTIIILKLISDKGDIDSLYGRIAIGFLLIQDLIAIFILFMLPLVASGNFTPSHVLYMFLKGTALLIGMYFVSRRIVPRLGHFMAQSQELLFLFTIAWGLGISSLFYAAGFGIESGALIAGISLATLPSRNEVSARLTPLRDFFIIMFFILLGAHMDLSNIQLILPAAILLSILVLIGNPIILMSIMGMLGYKKKTSLQTGFTVAQISEFSLILIALGLKMGHVSDDIVALVTLVGLITIFGSTYMILYSEKIYRWLEPTLSIFEKKNAFEHDTKAAKYEVILFGGNRVGHSFIELFNKKKSFLVIDHDPQIIEYLQLQGIHALYGDVSDITFLESLNLDHVKIIISTIPQRAANQIIIEHAQQHNPDIVTIATSMRIDESEKLYETGCDYVIMPHFLGSHHAAKIVARYKSDKTKYTKVRNTHIDELATMKDRGHQ